MFTGYNLKLNRTFFDNCKLRFDEYEKIGKEHLLNKISKYRNDLESYIHRGTISGSELQNDCFPIIDANIFISHSHNDTKLANALAGWIHDEFGLKVFIDSNVWGYSTELLDDINSMYSTNSKDGFCDFTYNYDDCCKVSQHVNMMLSVALQKMIDNVECVILLNTNNSIDVFDDQNKKLSTTYSPWIYSEITCTQIIRKKPLLYYREYTERSHINEGATFGYLLSELKIKYDISLLHLNDLDKKDLSRWSNNFKNQHNRDYKRYPLDALYCFKHPKELETTKNLFRSFNYNYIKAFKEAYDGNVDSYEFLEQVFSCKCINNRCSNCKCRRCKYVYEQGYLNE